MRAFALLALLHLYVGARLIPHLPGGVPVRLLAAGLLCGCLLLIPRGLRQRETLSSRRGRLLSWAGALCMGAFSSLTILTLLRDLLLAPATLLWPAGLPARLLSDSALAVVGLTVVATLIGLLQARRPRVVRVRVPLAQLPPDLQGLSIVQLSDLHVGATIRRDYVEAVVKRVNALQPDIVAITGDLVDGSVEQLAEQVAPLATLSARHGVFFVTGNHEYYAGAHAWIEHLRRLGMRVLLNEHVLIEHNGAALVLAGVTDSDAHHFDPSHKSEPRIALRGAPASVRPRILLAHRPRSAAAAAAAGFDLQLSGHTHGGQFWPWNLFVRLHEPFTAGLARLQQLLIYISRGTGYWGPPTRLGAPAEITQLTLQSAAGERARPAVAPGARRALSSRPAG